MSFADVTLANGVRLHYARQGPRDGPAIILLHGYSDSSFSFSRVMPLLPPELRVIAPDLRGHGRFGPAGRRLSHRRPGRRRDQHDGRAQGSVGGHRRPLDGQFRRAGDRRARAAAACRGSCCSASAPVADNDTVMRNCSAAVDVLTDPVDADFVRDFQYSTIAQPVPERVHGRGDRQQPPHAGAVWKQASPGLIEYRPAVPRPMCARWSRRHSRCGVLGRRADGARAAISRSAELQLIDDVGHTLHWEQPDSVS